MTLPQVVEVGTLVAAILAAVMAFLSIRASSYGRVADYRKEWNDRLRDDVANMLSEYVKTASNYSKEDGAKLIYYAVRIELSLDREKSLHITILRDLKTILDALIIQKKAPEGDVIAQFKARCSDLLENEWNRLKFETTNSWKIWKSFQNNAGKK